MIRAIPACRGIARPFSVGGGGGGGVQRPTITNKTKHQLPTKLNVQYLQIQPYKPGAEG